MFVNNTKATRTGHIHLKPEYQMIWGILFRVRKPVYLLFPLAMCFTSMAWSQVLVNLEGKYPVTMKMLGSGQRLVVYYHTDPDDGVRLETASTDLNWSFTPIASKRITETGSWLARSSAYGTNGIVVGGGFTVASLRRPNLILISDNGEFEWANLYVGFGNGPYAFEQVFSNGDSIVAYACGLMSPTIHRLVIGLDGEVIQNTAITSAANHRFEIYTGCTTQLTSENILAGSSFLGPYVGQAAWMARVGPSGVLWMKNYLVVGDGSAQIKGVVPAIGGGFTCTVTSQTSFPGSYQSNFLLHVDDAGDVQWCKALGSTSSWFGVRGITQLENGDYVVRATWDIFDDELYRFSSNGDLISRSACGFPCNLPTIGPYTDDPYPYRCMLIGNWIAEVDENALPCGRNSFTGWSMPEYDVFVEPIVSQPGNAPLITAQPILVEDRTPGLSVSISCGTVSSSAVQPGPLGLNAYPTPSSGLVMLSLDSERKRPIQVIDNYGRVVLQGFAPGDLNISELSPGIYDCFVTGTILHTRIVRE